MLLVIELLWLFLSGCGMVSILIMKFIIVIQIAILQLNRCARSLHSGTRLPNTLNAFWSDAHFCLNCLVCWLLWVSKIQHFCYLFNWIFFLLGFKIFSSQQFILVDGAEPVYGNRGRYSCLEGKNFGGGLNEVFTVCDITGNWAPPPDGFRCVG